MTLTTTGEWLEIEYILNEDTYDDDLEAAVKHPRYDGEYMFLSSFMRFHTPMDGWHGSYTTSNFGGYLIKLSDDGDCAMIGESFN